MRRALILAAAVMAVSAGAGAERIANPLAQFNGLEKITGVTTTFEIEVGREYRFGGLVVKSDACYTRPPTEEQKTTSFVEIYEIETDRTTKRIFSGWMFAESPGLNGLEHPIYDVWLTGCRDPNAPPAVVEEAPDLSTLQNQLDTQEQPED